MRMLIAWLCLVSSLSAASNGDTQSISFTIDGVQRTALLYVPKNHEGPMPLVFAYHGHGGSSRFAVNKFQLPQLWPEAISIYPQGLNTPGQLLDPEGKQPGWQKAPGDQGDRDLHFFDAMLAKLETDYSVDPGRVYCTGHSNGGGFTYLLWYTHPDLFAAVAPCSAAAPYVRQLKPLPALISGGKNDSIVKFQWQQATINVVQHINHCAGAGEPWEALGTIYPSTGNTPLVTYIYDGDHPMTPQEPGLIAKFFKQQSKPTTQPATAKD